MQIIFKVVLIGAWIIAWMFSPELSAQDKPKRENVFLHPDKFYRKYFPHLKIKYTPTDSNYIQSYPNNLTTAVNLLAPIMAINLNPPVGFGKSSQAGSDLRTNINTIIGFSGSYRHITAGFALGTVIPNVGNTEGYTDTRYRTATIKYRSPIYALEFKYLRMKGMTDINTDNSPDKISYVLRPDMVIKEYHFEGVYNFNWKKYSYIAPLDYTQRQMKSCMGFLIKAGIYNHQLYGDSNVLSVRQRPYFNEVNDITKMVSYTIKLAPGIGGTLVLKKRFYLSASLFSPLNMYISRLYEDENNLAQKETNIQWTLDGNVCVGYQSNRFYGGLKYELDGRTANLSYLSYTTVYNYIGVNIGYRFNTPKFIKKFYKDTMPPGM